MSQLNQHPYIAQFFFLCLLAPEDGGSVAADHSVPWPDRKDGSCFSWKANDDK